MQIYELDLVDNNMWQIALIEKGNYTVIDQFSSVEESINYLKSMSGEVNVIDMDIVGIVILSDGKVKSVDSENGVNNSSMLERYNS